MLSRVAERTYWLARYLERAEATARLLLVRHLSTLDLPREAQPDWGTLLEVLGAHESFAEQPGALTEENVIRYLFIDRENPSSLICSLSAARENMRTTREILPSESWELVNSLYLSVARRSNKGLPRSSRHAVLNNIIRSCQQISGMLLGTMSHNTAYQFLMLGCMVERVDMCTRFIDVGSEDLLTASEHSLPYQNVLWTSVLQSLSAYQMYRLSVRARVTPEDVIKFLLRDPHFPRSLLHSLMVLEESMQTLPGHEKVSKSVSRIRRRVARFRVEISPDEPYPVALGEFLDNVQIDMQALHQAIDTAWFHPAN